MVCITSKNNPPYADCPPSRPPPSSPSFVLGATLSSPSTHVHPKEFNPDRPNSVGLFTDDRPLEVQADFGASVQITGFWTMYDAHPFTMKVRNSPDDEWVLHHTGFGTCAFPEPAVARYAQVIFESTKQAPSWVSGYRGVLGRFMGHVVEPGFSNHWRLYNGNVVMGSWAIREVIFYSDRDCTQPLPRTERVDHYFDHHKGLPDVSSSQQEHLAISAMDESETTYWQVSDEASASCEEAECHWYGFKFFAAVTVQCVELHQGDSPNTEQALYKMNPIRLKYLDSQGEWAQAAQWDTPDADYPMLQVHDPHVPRSASNRRRLRYVQEAQPPPSRDPQPQHCFDGVQNTGEIDVDCGGPCDDCAALEIDELLVSSGAINGVAWAGGTQLAIGTGDETFEIRKFMGKLHDYEPVTKQTSDGPVVAVAFASTEETAASLAVQNGGHSVLDLYAPQKVGVPDSGPCLLPDLHVPRKSSGQI